MISRLYRSFRDEVARQLGIRGRLDRLQAIEAKCDRIETKVAAPIITTPAALTQEAREQFRREWQDEQNLELEHARTTDVVSRIRQTLLMASPASWFRVDLNGTECLRPRATITEMVHCIYCPVSPQIANQEEITSEYLGWMFDSKKQRCVLFDVDAATETD